MNASLALPQTTRLPLWYAPLLLPVLPALALLLNRDRMPGPAAWLAIGALAALGVALALLLPGLLERVSHLTRKEVEQIRSTWLISVFLVQLPALLPSGGSEISALFYLGTCLLLAVLPFGTEFQHRTLHALLSQPVGRRALWRTKAGILGVALAMHGLLALLLLLASFWMPAMTVRYGQSLTSTAPGNATQLAYALGAFAVATFAIWGSGILWSLIGRGVIPGLVFALAVPLIPGVIVAVLPEASAATHSGSSETAFNVLLWGLLPAYGAACAAIALHRWKQLEATDTGDEGGHSLLARTRVETGVAVPRRHHTVLRALGFKEMRLQTVTLVLLGLAIVVGLALPFISFTTISGAGFSQREVAFGIQVLLTCAVLLLAGATPIAEERRMGTLDAQILQPITATKQWLVKTAFGITMAVGAVLILALSCTAVGTGFLHPALVLGVLLIAGFAFTLSFLGSASSPNVLRALLIGVFGSLAAAVIFSLITAPALDWVGRGHSTPIDQPAPSMEWAWKAAETIDPAVAREWSGPASPYPAFLRAAYWLLGIYVTLAGGLWMLILLRRARTHFSRPALSPRQSVLLLMRVLGIYLALTVTGAMGFAFAMKWVSNRVTVAQAWRLRDWRAKLPSADRLLLDRYGVEWLQSARVLFPPEAAQSPEARKLHVQFGWYVHGTNGVGVKHFNVPLNTEHRRFIVEHGWIDDTTRAALRAQIDAGPGATTDPVR